MIGARIFTDLYAQLTGRLTGRSNSKKSDPKPVWGAQSPITLLAAAIERDPKGWIFVNGAARSSSGVEIAWKGSLLSAQTPISVKMDGQKYRVYPAEAAEIKSALSRILESQSGAN